MSEDDNSSSLNNSGEAIESSITDESDDFSDTDVREVEKIMETGEFQTDRKKPKKKKKITPEFNMDDFEDKKNSCKRNNSKGSKEDNSSSNSDNENNNNNNLNSINIKKDSNSRKKKSTIRKKNPGAGKKKSTYKKKKFDTNEINGEPIENIEETTNDISKDRNEDLDNKINDNEPFENMEINNHIENNNNKIIDKQNNVPESEDGIIVQNSTKSDIQSKKNNIVYRSFKEVLKESKKKKEIEKNNSLNNYIKETSNNTLGEIKGNKTIIKHTDENSNIKISANNILKVNISKNNTDKINENKNIVNKSNKENNKVLNNNNKNKKNILKKEKINDEKYNEEKTDEKNSNEENNKEIKKIKKNKKKNLKKEKIKKEKSNKEKSNQKNSNLEKSKEEHINNYPKNNYSVPEAENYFDENYDNTDNINNIQIYKGIYVSNSNEDLNENKDIENISLNDIYGEKILISNKFMKTLNILEDKLKIININIKKPILNDMVVGDENINLISIPPKNYRKKIQNYNNDLLIKIIYAEGDNLIIIDNKQYKNVKKGDEMKVKINQEYIIYNYSNSYLYILFKKF